MAALVNGALIHSLEYDDTHIGSVVHGSPESAGRLSAHLDNLGTVWHLPDVAFKLYPCCHYIHPFLEAMQMLINDGLHPGDVAAITCHVPPPMVPLICEPWGRRQRPASGYDGKWGLAYCLAALLMGDRVDVATFATPPDPKIVDAARRIEWLPMESHTFPRRFEALVEVQSHDGRAFHHRIDSVRGAPDRPVAEAEVVAKFRANAGRAMTDGAVEIARLVILTLDHARTLAPLTEALRNIRRWSNPFTSSGWVGTTRCWGR
jgi:2-methylcitrate dehydratase PrpD